MNAMDLEELRAELDRLNRDILKTLNLRAGVVRQVRRLKEKQAHELFAPSREKEMLDRLAAENTGPFSDDTIRHLFKEIFRASLDLMAQERAQSLLVSRGGQRPDVVINVKG